MNTTILKTSRTLLLSILAACALATHAQDVPLANSPDLVAFQQRLKVLYPSTAFSDLRATPIANVFEARMGQNIVYIEGNGRYFLFGKIFDMPNQVDLTEARMQEINKIDVAQLPLKDAIKTVKGNGGLGKRTMYVFSDPDCPFCKRLEANLQGLTDVTIYTFLYPIPSLHPDAPKKAASIWCAPDRNAAWDNAMLKEKDPAPLDCTNPVARNMELGNQLSVTGTPTMISADGRRRAGATDADTLSRWLDADSSGKTAQKATKQ